ncbi:MAG: PEP-CTERM-box response regulator transcription factor [Nitrospirae bacterium]|nr:PEP-CTERM-box response regulator transcription factor [Nitrospirota bacterium]
MENKITTDHQLNLLIVEDDVDLREQMKFALASDYSVLQAGDRATAMDIFRERDIPLVILDLGLPPAPHDASEGLAILEEMLGTNGIVKVIVTTGNTERANAMKAIELGAYDFLEKPVQLDLLRVCLQRGAYLFRVESENLSLQNVQWGQVFEEMIGASPIMEKVFDTIHRVASSDVPVLISGESGTGKELVARALHKQSTRNHGAFVVINCAAIPEPLLESELFGHERGAFTGAHLQRKGRFEQAHGGTLFLDEIGELTLPLQVKLLRFLQDQQIDRVGGRTPIRVDARLIAATNRNLEEGLKSGNIREDLYYRLQVVQIEVPPLRERVGDIPLLANVFLQKYAEEFKKRITGFTPQGMAAIESHEWPGNIRELENTLKRAIILSDGPKLSHQDLNLQWNANGGHRVTLKAAREVVEKELIQRVLGKHGGNITKTAGELGVSRPTMHDLVTRYDIQR